MGCRIPAWRTDNFSVPTDLPTILSLRVPVIVEIGRRRLPLDDVLSLTPGAIIELSKSSDEDLDVRVNNICIGRGRAVKVGENFGIRLGGIQSPQERVEALGGS